MAERLRESGQEYGASTGRPRRCGWFDAPIARYAARINGVTDFVLTKLDVLTGLEQIPVCVAYDVDGVRHDEMPMTQTDFHHAKPVYEEMPGWFEDIRNCRTFDELPAAAQAYVRRLEELSGARISVIGVGPGRDENVVVEPSGWFAIQMRYAYLAGDPAEVTLVEDRVVLVDGVVTVQGVTTAEVAEPHDDFNLFVEAEPHQGIQSKTGIAHPAVSIVPVTVAAQRFGQRRRRCGDDAARRA